MKLQFKHQRFQADAAKAVRDVFAGQPTLAHKYSIDPGKDLSLPGLKVGWNNNPIAIPDDLILANLRKVQLANGLKPSSRLERSESCRLRNCFHKRFSKV